MEELLKGPWKVNVPSSPHKLLNAYVYQYSSFTPVDTGEDILQAEDTPRSIEVYGFPWEMIHGGVSNSSPELNTGWVLSSGWSPQKTYFFNVQVHSQRKYPHLAYSLAVPRRIQPCPNQGWAWEPWPTDCSTASADQRTIGPCQHHALSQNLWEFSWWTCLWCPARVFGRLWKRARIWNSYHPCFNMTAARWKQDVTGHFTVPWR